MNIWAYTIVRNEEAILPWWLTHYQSFCSKVIVYDDRSDDRTPAILEHYGADVRDLPYSGLDDGQQAQFSSFMYREARGWADFVIVVDADEFLVGDINPTWTLPAVHGYQMFADPGLLLRIPEGNLPTLAPKGVPYPPENKWCVFRPELDVRFGVGRHFAEIPGLTKEQFNYNTTLKLLHYRWFGRAYSEARNVRNFVRLSRRAHENQWGFHTWPQYSPQWADEQEQMALQAKAVV